MNQFSRLFLALDATTRTSEKQKALIDYFREASAKDAAWAVYYLSGRRKKRLVKTAQLREWVAEVSGYPLWLVEESYHVVGDLAETAAHLLPEPERTTDIALADLIEQRLLPLANLDDEDRKQALIKTWSELDAHQRLVWNKLITGGFRIGVARTLVARALAELVGISPAEMAHRLMGEWEPTPQFFATLMSGEAANGAAQPYPFCLAPALDLDPAELGDPADWQAEWKWDGIRAQVIWRQGDVLIWTRGEELVTDRYPEVVEAAAGLPDGTVLDGELLAWRDGAPLGFGELQRRIGRKKVGPKLLREVPVALMVYDLLEADGVDARERPLTERQQKARELVSAADCPHLLMAIPVPFSSWSEAESARASSRAQGVEGLMLKRLNSCYGVGRRKGAWWKWKVEPYTVDAVLIYAQAGHGRRANLFTDYTFAVWRDDELVPFAKAYSGLNDKEIREVDRFVRRNTKEKFGPVRSVSPELVFELAFDDIRLSTRHKSGIAVRFPRMKRWRKDKPASEADSLETVEALLHVPGEKV